MLVWGVVALAALLGFAFWGGSDFCLDDAWIHLAYARSLQLGDGLSYNPHDFETGASSPLWVLLLAVVAWGAQPIAAVKALGILLHAATAGAAACLAASLARLDVQTQSRGSIALAMGVAGVLTAGHPALLQASSSGMEVSLASALLLGTAWLALEGRTALACAAAMLSVWARPESLFFVGAFALVHAVALGRPRKLLPAGAALLGLGIWVAYCVVVSGYPWPNTKYAKEVGLAAEGLLYLGVQVVPSEPWLVGLGGVVLAVVALRRAQSAQRAALLALALGWLVTIMATALSRPFAMGVLFYYARYFAIVAPVPAIVVALGASRMRLRTALLLLVPVLAAQLALSAATHSLKLAQEADITQLHTEPARYIARTLPPSARVIVEGAGATRFFTPRSMTLLDMLGLNLRVLAHARDDRDRLCGLLAHKPTHLLVPDEYAGITHAFEVRSLHRFVDERYHQRMPPIRRGVELFELLGAKPWLVATCSARKP